MEKEIVQKTEQEDKAMMKWKEKIEINKEVMKQL